MKTQTVSEFNATAMQLPDIVGLPVVEVPVWEHYSGFWFIGQGRTEWMNASAEKNKADHAAGLWSVGNTREEAIANYHARKPGAKKKHVWPVMPEWLPKLPDGAVYLGMGGTFPEQVKYDMMLIGFLPGESHVWDNGGNYGSLPNAHYAAPIQAIADRIAAQMEAAK